MVNFNHLLLELSRRTEALNMRGEGFNRDQDAYNAYAASVNKRCAGQLVTFRDRDAVANERAAQGKR